VIVMVNVVPCHVVHGLLCLSLGWLPWLCLNLCGEVFQAYVMLYFCTAMLYCSLKEEC
jgi:hypothetical protein